MRQQLSARESPLHCVANTASVRYVSQCAADLCAYLCRLLASDLDGDLLQLVAPQHGAPGQDVSGGVADVIADPRSRATALGGQTSVSCADSLVIAPGMRFGGGGAGPGICVGGGGTSGLAGAQSESSLMLSEGNRNLYLISGQSGRRQATKQGRAADSAPALLMQTIQRQRAAAMSDLDFRNGPGKGGVIDSRMISADQDVLAHMGWLGGRSKGMNLRTLHLLDVLAAYFPYCKSGVTEALVCYLTAQHAVPSIDQYIQLLPKRSGFDFDLHVYNKVSQTPALLMVLEIISFSRDHLAKCWQHLKSLLATCIGLWCSAKEASLHRKHDPLLLLTRKVLQVISRAGWLSDPWTHLSVLLEHLAPAELVIRLQHLHSHVYCAVLHGCVLYMFYMNVLHMDCGRV